MTVEGPPLVLIYSEANRGFGWHHLPHIPGRERLELGCSSKGLPQFPRCFRTVRRARLRPKCPPLHLREVWRRQGPGWPKATQQVDLGHGPGKAQIPQDVSCPRCVWALMVLSPYT